MKRVVRTGFELVMARTHKYTRDLYPCYKEFSKYYPKRKNEMRKALQLCIVPTDNVKEISFLLNSLGKFLEQKTIRVFRKSNVNLRRFSSERAKIGGV